MAEDEEDGGPAWARVLKSPWASLAGILIGLGLATYYPDLGAPFAEAFRAAVGAVGTFVPYIIFFTIISALVELFDLGGGLPPVVVVVLFTFTTIVAGIFAILVAWPVFGLPITGAATGGIVQSFSQVAENLGTAPAMIAVVWAFLSAFVLHMARVLGRSSHPDDDGTAWERFLARIVYVGGETRHVLAWVGGPGVRYIGTVFEYGLPLILFLAGTFVPDTIRAAADRAREEGGQALDVDPALMYLGTAVLIAVVSGLYLLGIAVLSTRLTRTSLRRGLTDYLPPVYGFAWATASSSLTIPINLEAAEEGLEARESTRNFVIPLGATINLDGTMIGAMLITPVTMAALGLDLTLVQLIATFVPLVLVTVGAPGIPGGLSLLAPPILATVLGLEGATQTAFIGVWFAFSFGLTDQFRTAANSTNNGFLCLLVDWIFDKMGVERIEADRATVEAAGGGSDAASRVGDEADAPEPA